MSLSDIRKKNSKKSLLEIRTINGEYPEDLIEQCKNTYENLVKPVRERMIEELIVKRLEEDNRKCYTSEDAIRRRGTIIEKELVYCVNCKHLKLEEIHKGKGDYIASCSHEKECEIYDIDDSRPISERPYYEEEE